MTSLYRGLATGTYELEKIAEEAGSKLYMPSELFEVLGRTSS